MLWGPGESGGEEKQNSKTQREGEEAGWGPKGNLKTDEGLCLVVLLWLPGLLQSLDLSWGGRWRLSSRAALQCHSGHVTGGC